MRKLRLVSLALFFIVWPSVAFSLQATVIQVKDGDTIVVEPSSLLRKRFTCRLYGIDAPETPHSGKPGQPYGFEAKEELKRLVYLDKVKVTLTGEKTYRRKVCIIEKDGLDVSLEMVKLGYAWAFRRHLKKPYASIYLEAEKEARASRLGLWQQRNPQPPWEFRKKISAPGRP